MRMGTVTGAKAPKRRAAAAAGALAAGLVLSAAGCKQDCSGPARLGDFEFSQGNYVNAVKQYEKALRADPKCYNVEGKLAEARTKATSSH
jgi:cytochrome c-type biogenesis protein CcmH/NrfG